MLKNFWTTKKIIFSILVIILLLLIPKIIGILLLFFAAYVISCALNPFVNKFQKKMSRTLAAASVLIVSMLSIVALFIPICFVTYREIRTFFISLPEKIETAVRYFNSIKIFGQNIEDVIDFNTILSSSSGLSPDVFTKFGNFTIGLLELAVVFIAMGMIIYYILVDKNYLKNKFLEFFPSELKIKADYILASISNRVGGYVRAQILSMVAIGVMTAIFLAILGVDYPILLGLITGVLDIIPILGPSVALAVILLVAYPLGLVKIALTILIFLTAQQLSNYIVRPILFGKFMALHPLMIFFALFVAQQFLGFWGVILSPAIAATVCVLIDELYIAPINQPVEIEEQYNEE